MLLLAAEPTLLQNLWFILIAVLWIGYLVLEGFDYGVAMLIPFLGKTEKERRVIVNTIGPVWDGNQVWLLTAGGAMFAAFPAWYATLFSGLYIPLFLVLFGLIIRGVSFEYRAKNPDTGWRNTFDWMAAIGSFLVALVFGVGFANFIIGMPASLSDSVTSLYVMDNSMWALFSPFGLLGGIVLVVLFLFHGANYLALKTKGVVHDRAHALAGKIGLAAIVGGAVYLVWANLAYGFGLLGWVIAALAAVALIGSWVAARAGRDGWAFILTGLTTLLVAVWIFGRMYPTMGFATEEIPGNALTPFTIANASSTPLTLQIMTVAAVVFVPIVLGYTAWAYWVNRRRLSEINMPDEAPEQAPVA